MLVPYAILLISIFRSATCAEELLKTNKPSVTSIRTRRGIIEPGHHFVQDRQYYQPKVPTPYVPTAASYNKNAKVHAQKFQKLGGNPNTNSQSSHQYLPKYPPSYSVLPSSTRQHETRVNNAFTPQIIVADDAKSSPKLQGLSAYATKPNVFAISRTPNYKENGYSYSKIPQNTSPSANVQVPVYKTNFGSSAGSYPQNYASHVDIASNQGAGFRSSEKGIQNGAFSDSVNVNGKKIPLPALKLHGAQSQPGFASFESQVVPKIGSDFEAVPRGGFNVDSENVKADAVLRNGAPFLSPHSSFQAKVVPIHTSGSGAQFPQYKGASVEGYPAGAALSKVLGTYEPIQTHAQLHFGKGSPAYSLHPVNRQPGVPLSPVFEKIRSDTEVIDKTKLKPAPPKDEGSDEDEGFKDVEREYGPSSQKDDDYDYTPGKYFKESTISISQGDFKPSTSFPFKQYDETFGKYTKQTSEEDVEEKPYSKHENFGNEEDKQPPSYKYHSEYSASKPSYGKYEAEEENDEGVSEESEREKPEGSPEYAYSHRNTEISRPSKYYNKEYEKDFDESYKKGSLGYNKRRS